MITARPLSARGLMAKALTAYRLGESGDFSRYAVLGKEPEFTADFTRDYYRTDSSPSDFDTAFTFTRASAATYVDSTGTLQTAASGEPRLGHHVWDGSQWVNEGLLIESESRTNLITHSEDFTDASWNLQEGTLDSSSAVAPDGTLTATKFIEDETPPINVKPTLWAAITAASATYTQSVYIKDAGDTRFLEIRPFGLGSGVYYAKFNPATGEVTDSGGTALIGAFSENVGDGWFRVSVVFNAQLFAGDGVMYGVSATDTGELVAYAGDGTSGIYIWGAQLEAASTPSSYIPTSGSTATRAAETKDSDSLSHDSSAMWFTLDGLETYADEGTAGQVTLFDWRADANNRITVTLDTDSTETGEITLTVVSGGTSWSVAADYLSPGVNQPFSLAWRVTSSEINLAVGGTAQTAVSTTSIPDLSAATASWEGMGARALFRQGTGDIGDAGIAEASS